MANAELQGSDAKSAAQIQQWINFSDNEILPAACTWVFPCLGIVQYNKQVDLRSKASFCIFYFLTCSYRDDLEIALLLSESFDEDKHFLLAESAVIFFA